MQLKGSYTLGMKNEKHIMVSKTTGFTRKKKNKVPQGRHNG